MKDDILKHLYDIREAALAVKNFVADKSLEDYRGDELLSSAVERKLEIIGESLNRLRRDDPSILSQIRDHRDIISFRNILAHGYNNIDERIVWGIIREDLDHLLEDVQKLLPHWEDDQPAKD